MKHFSTFIIITLTLSFTAIVLCTILYENSYNNCLIEVDKFHSTHKNTIIHLNDNITLTDNNPYGTIKVISSHNQTISSAKAWVLSHNKQYINFDIYETNAPSATTTIFIDNNSMIRYTNCYSNTQPVIGKYILNTWIGLRIDWDNETQTSKLYINQEKWKLMAQKITPCSNNSTPDQAWIESGASSTGSFQIKNIKLT